MKFWAVTSSYDDRGNGYCGLTDIVEADEKPETVYKYKARRDIYIDYFESYEEAEDYIRLQKRA